MNFVGKARPLTSRGMSAVCEMLDVGEPEIWAVLTVETNGFGFLNDRRPLILFERHVFSKLTHGRFDRDAPDISNKTPGGYKGKEAEYPRLDRAMQLDLDAALQSASWGLAQVMGFNFRSVGFDDVSEMVTAMVANEDTHLDALGQFIRQRSKCRIGLQRRDWGTFAACYNGPNFKINDYDNRLAAAFEKSNRLLPDIGYRTAQAALAFLGIDPGPIDGIRGRKTRGALFQFQGDNALPATGELDGDTEVLLLTRAFPET